MICPNDPLTSTEGSCLITVLSVQLGKVCRHRVKGDMTTNAGFRAYYFWEPIQSQT